MLFHQQKKSITLIFISQTLVSLAVIIKFSKNCLYDIDIYSQRGYNFNENDYQFYKNEIRESVHMSKLTTEHIAVSYNEHTIINDLNIEVPEGMITSIIGPNGCGKSTLLKTISRILKPDQGAVYLNGRSIHQLKTKEVAKEMAILAQTPDIPQTLTVSQLVAFGRYPHRRKSGRLTAQDKKAVAQALEDTGMSEYKDRPLDALSGGQRQRAWISMALAQETDVLLLDEPTTYLDMAHQLEILELLQELNEKEERTIVMIIHDLNHAARFSDHLIAMKAGEIQHIGAPHEVISKPVLRRVFGIDAYIVQDPRTGKPLCMTYDLVDTHLAPVPDSNTQIARV
ncbi:iron complex transport system ATP-binding protein [Alteribacillus persepolensis]|uniref:Iron complex transport system ATP-binding protein n=2 Tax=Alteribacillus persepolensis TaxID=568899 RepID=A0A1G8C6K9_9BACI|nr:iron complex transport system ATP-binding protein [Alteribacillus persepolensis]